ncbi:MAG: 4Fe-4S binding protein [Caldisphaeraceae archaeon]|nr:4Fe-4S binding protein [Caldisphaeraceae archaeon]
MATETSYTERLKSWNRIKVQKISLKAPVTTLYPLIDIEKPPEYRGVPHINPEKCIGCGACVNACPPDALSIEWDKKNGVKRIVYNAARCIRCARCIEVCPTGAMEPTTRFEAASNNKEDMVEVVEHKLARCKGCGNYLDFTERQIEYTLKIIPKEILDSTGLKDRIQLCGECKMKETVKKLKETGEYSSTLLFPLEESSPKKSGKKERGDEVR